jgi:hypothetical protein
VQRCNISSFHSSFHPSSALLPIRRY